MSPRFSGTAALAASLLAINASGASSLVVKKLTDAPALVASPMHFGGRVVPLTGEKGKTSFRFQWPGVYFVSEVKGPQVFFEVGNGDAIYHVLVDGEAAVKLVKPAPGIYAVDGLSASAHVVRVEVASEQQAVPAQFGGILVEKAAAGRAPNALKRQIEFIGDSHTVGYGNTSTKRECTPQDVWLTTDTSKAFGPLTANRLRADYQINAISGRGIVRNYNGTPGSTLPEAYPFALFDKSNPHKDPAWQPQLVVIYLGTNDFSTPLNPGDKWKTRDELHADYEKTYVDFVHQLRAKFPKTFFILAANDQANGEVQQEVTRVVAQLTATGETRLGFVLFATMELTACDWHPSLADNRQMSEAISTFVDAHPEVWENR